MCKRIAMEGKVFGHLTVLEYVGNEKWKCLCDCGNISYPNGNSLRTGKTKSCGCGYQEKLVDSLTTHGKRHTRIYSIYTNMKSRCYNKNRSNYKYYGGKGIQICDDWKSSFENFYKWSMSNGYTDDLEIDRIDNSLGYSPENCRFVTRIEQIGNRTNSLYIVVNEEKILFKELCKKQGVDYKTAHNQLRQGVSVQKIFKDLKINNKAALCE